MSNYNNDNFNEDVANDAMNNPAVNKAKQSLAKKAKKATGALARKLVKALSKALLMVAKLLLPYIAIIGGLLLFVTIGYFIIFEFTGTEKEYIKKYENEFIVDENNMIVANESTMNVQNKAVRDFYRYFSGQSFWQLIGRDNSKLISPDHEDSVRDYYKREDMFKLNSNFLFSLDDFLYKGDWKYPEQIIKPVNYDKNDLILEPLIDDEGFVIVESDEEDVETGEKTGNKILSVRDFGLASILKYNDTEDWKRTLKVKGTYVAQDVWDPVSKSVIVENVNIPFDLDMDGYPEDINLIDKVISFTGEIEYEYEYRETKFGDLVPGQTDKENEPKTEYLYGIHEEPIYEEYVDEFGEIVVELVGYDRYELYRYRGDDSAIVEKLPTVVNTNVENRGDSYLKSYLHNFESYIPINTINDFEFEDRIDYDSYVFDYDAILSDDYGFNLGSARDSQSFEKSLQYKNIVEQYSAEFGVDPYIIIAMISQESGGNPKINGNGLMQITSSGDTTITAKNIYGTSETYTLKMSERQDPEKSIKYGIMYFAYLLDLMDGDPYKAIQAYNFGEGTMGDIRREHPDAWNSNFGWLLYREKARLGRGGSNSKSASYECMAFPEGRMITGRYWGDSCYLENVLRYYAGNNIENVEGVEKNTVWDKLKGLGSLFMKFIKIEDKDELIPKADFLGHAKYDRVSDILKTTYALDNTVLFSDSEENSEDLNFWDEGFMESVVSIGLSLQEILDIAPNPNGYLPPIILGENGATVTSHFGMRFHPVDKVNKLHGGIDIGTPIGTHLYAIADGKVVMARMNGTAGNEIRIDHGNGVESRYLHMNQFAVKEGDLVTQGQMIGTSGNTGKSTGPHLHFEFIKDGVKLDPAGIVLGQ